MKTQQYLNPREQRIMETRWVDLSQDAKGIVVLHLEKCGLDDELAAFLDAKENQDLHQLSEILESIGSLPDDMFGQIAKEIAKEERLVAFQTRCLGHKAKYPGFDAEDVMRDYQKQTPERQEQMLNPRFSMKQIAKNARLKRRGPLPEHW